MKKIIFTLVLLLSIGVHAQAEKNAQNITNEITEVLDLSKKDSEKVYEMALERVQNIRAFKKANPEMSEKELKENTSKYGKEFSKSLRALVGDDKMKELSEYRKKKKSNN